MQLIIIIIFKEHITTIISAPPYLIILPQSSPHIPLGVYIIDRELDSS